MNEAEIRESIDCLTQVDEEILALFDAFQHCYKEHLADEADDVKWNIATAVSSYLLIKICVFREELGRYFLKSGGGTDSTKEELATLNRLMDEVFDVKTIRDSVLAHNRLRVSGKYRPLTAEERENLHVPRSIEQFEIILGAIDRIILHVEHESRFLDKLEEDDGKEYDELEKFISEGGDIEKLIQKRHEEFLDEEQERAFKESLPSG